MIFGLGAAIGWGVADLLAAVVSRRMGSMGTVVVAQVAGLLALGVLFVATGASVDVPTSDAIVLLLNGVLLTFSYLTVYRALELGPVSLVAPIVAAYAPITVLLAVVLLGESLAGAVLAGMVVTVVGVVLASTDLRMLRRPHRLPRSGIPHALATMVLSGFVAFVLGRYAQKLGWFLPIAISRAGAIATLVVVVGLSRKRVLREAGRLNLSAAALVGLVDILAATLYARGSELGFVSIVATASATFTLIPVAGGVLLFGERAAINQGVGVVLVVIGLLLLGLGR